MAEQETFLSSEVADTKTGENPESKTPRAKNCETMTKILKWSIAGVVVVLILIGIVSAFWPSIQPLTMQPGCVMYGTCGGSRTCANTTLPSPLAPAHLQSLERVCPALVAEHGSSALCCSADQVQDLVAKLDDAMLDLCPSCGYNLRQLFCNLVCSPYQSTWANVTRSVAGPEEGQRIATQVEFKVSDAFGNATFDSCKGVMTEDRSSKILDHLCGIYGSRHCDPHKFFSKITEGKGKSSDFVEYNVDFWWFDPNNDRDKLMLANSFNKATVSCGDSPPGTNRTCRADDCAELQGYVSVPQ